MKTCTKCKQLKSFTEFHKRKDCKDGYRSRCKNCRNEDNRKYHHSTPELQKAREKRYRKSNSDKVRKAKRKYIAKRRVYDTSYRILIDTRSRIIHALNGSNKSKSTRELIGCTIEELKVHLQQTAISNGYKNFNIDSYSGKDYHVDHIKPCSSFNLEDKEEQRKCFHYTNLQILTAEENLIKGDKVV